MSDMGRAVGACIPHRMEQAYALYISILAGSELLTGLELSQSASVQGEAKRVGEVAALH